MGRFLSMWGVMVFFVPKIYKFPDNTREIKGLSFIRAKW